MPDSDVAAQGHVRELRGTAHVAVIVLHWGAAAMTARCLESLGRTSFAGKKTVFVIDNARSLAPGFGDDVPGLDLEIRRPARNLGFAGGCAWGLSLAMESGADFLLLLNNDAVLDSACLDRLVTAAAETPDAGLLCPLILSMTDPPKPWYLGGRFSLWSGMPVQSRSPGWPDAAGRPRQVDYATGCAMLLTPEVVRTVGSFDPRFFAYCEDLDLSLRARRAGFKVVFVPGALVHHAAHDADHLSRSLYYSTRNLLEVMRRHAAWYHWGSFAAHFVVRWVGFFTVLAVLRARPDFVRALARGVVDFATGRRGEGW